ncbi:MAG: hypothetical protein U5L46_12095 [Agrobacterium sp.]|nr:hypothetical protein [Agrobacterium sp.]
MVRDAMIVFIMQAGRWRLVGGVLALFLRGMPFSVSAAVGFIALSGIAVLKRAGDGHGDPGTDQAGYGAGLAAAEQGGECAVCGR